MNPSRISRVGKDAPKEELRKIWNSECDREKGTCEDFGIEIYILWKNDCNQIVTSLWDSENLFYLIPMENFLALRAPSFELYIGKEASWV